MSVPGTRSVWMTTERNFVFIYREDAVIQHRPRILRPIPTAYGAAAGHLEFLWVPRCYPLKIHNNDGANTAHISSHIHIRRWCNQTPSPRWATKAETYQELPAQMYDCPAFWLLHGGKKGGVMGRCIDDPIAELGRGDHSRSLYLKIEGFAADPLRLVDHWVLFWCLLEIYNGIVCCAGFIITELRAKFAILMIDFLD